MGNRATYALVEAGVVRFYYDHWGGHSIPADALAGPEGTAAYLRGLEAADRLLDTVWAEGGLLLDADRRVLLVWGGDALRWTPYLRRPYLPALRRLWPGWRVAWPVLGVVDLARHLGVAEPDVLGTPRGPAPGEEAPAADETLDRPVARDDPDALCTVLTVRGPDGRLTDYALHEAAWASAVLAWGPPLLDRLRARGPAPLPSEARADAGAYLDGVTRTLWVWEATTLDPRYLAGLGRRRAGWRVRGHTEGLARQVALSGRDPSTVPGLVVPEAQAIAELSQELTRDFGYDGGTKVPRIADLLRAQAGPDPRIAITPAALSRHAPALSAAARRRIVNDLFGADWPGSTEDGRGRGDGAVGGPREVEPSGTERRPPRGAADPREDRLSERAREPRGDRLGVGERGHREAPTAPAVPSWERRRPRRATARRSAPARTPRRGARSGTRDRRAATTRRRPDAPRSPAPPPGTPPAGGSRRGR
jgi:hypothetical protein